MTDERDISRRNALKGIAGAGALVGGVGLGFAGSASAQVHPNYPQLWIDDVVFWKDGSATIVFEEGTPFPIEDVEFTYYNPDLKTKVTATPRVDEDTTTTRSRFGDRPVFEFSGRVNADNDKVLAVRIGDKTYRSKRRKRKCKRHRRRKKKPRHGIDVEGVCHKKKKNRAQFRVDNDTKKDVKVSWTVVDGDQGGKLNLSKKGSETIWVNLEHGKKTKVAIYYDDEKVAVAKVDTDDHC